MSKTALLLVGTAGVFFLAFLCLISKGVRRFTGVLFNSLLGVGLLMVCNTLGTTFAVAVNLPTIIISVILGLPGAVALFFLKLILGI